MSIEKNLAMPFSAQQMYDLVNDVEAYPEFLPWCKATQVHMRDLTNLRATIHLAKGALNHSITTHNQMQPHEKITMEYVAGPFKYCSGMWQFIADDAGNGCQVKFSMDYQFSNRLTALAVESVFNSIINNLIHAFYQRAVILYGS